MLRDTHRQARARSQARLRQRARPVRPRPPVPGRTPAHQPRAGHRRGPRGVAVARSETVSLMVNEEDHLRLQVMRSGFALDEAWQEIDRVDDLLEAERHLRLQRGVRLPDRLPHQRRHRHAGQRHAAPAGPGATPSRSKKSSAPCKRSTWPCAACTAKAAGRRATSTRSPTRSRSARARRPSSTRSTASSRSIIDYERQARADLAARQPPEPAGQGLAGPTAPSARRR